jgi:hypothetical protein
MNNLKQAAAQYTTRVQGNESNNHESKSALQPGQTNKLHYHSIVQATSSTQDPNRKTVKDDSFYNQTAYCKMGLSYNTTL